MTKSVKDEANPGGSSAITVAEAAKEMAVSPDRIINWIKEGHFPVFVPPGVQFGDNKRGPKGYRIWRVDWEAFKQRHTRVGGLNLVSPRPPERLTMVTMMNVKRKKRER